MPDSALATDLYQLTMIAGYVDTGRHAVTASFEMFVRRFPPHRHTLIFAGLAQAVEYIRELRFSSDDIAWLRTLPVFSRASAGFFSYLRDFRFTGDVWAMPEGTPFFPNEPVLRVSAPLAEAQLLETALLSILNFQSAIASKAHRIVLSAAGRPVMEFGARRAHGLGAALHAARAAYLAGCAGTSFVEAGRRFGIPLSGTMAHSWILAAPSEREAFTSYAELYGRHTVLLLDTFDVAAAAAVVGESGLRPAAVRLDSGDLGALSFDVRRTLDAAGLHDTQILVSGDLDERKIADLIAARAPIDGFAVGTALTTSEDAPALGGVYKLVELDEKGTVRRVMKRSAGKATWPGKKQVWRILDGGVATRDIVALEEEPAPPGAMPLLEPIVRAGEIAAAPRPLDELRAHRGDMVRMLPGSLQTLDAAAPYPVGPSRALSALIGGGR